MSRPKRWHKAVGDAQTALATLQEAFSELESLKEEYSEWRDNLPEGLDQSPVAEKLDAIIDIDFECGIDDIETAINEAEGADLPLGFGRD